MRNWHTVVIVSVFALGYLYFTARKTARQQLDIYDLIMLSAVAIMPSAFVLLPDLAEYLSRLAGVAFPFVIMFGALFAILFIFVHRLTAKIHRLEHDNRLLIQELSLLKAAICMPTTEVSASRVRHLS
ncbi:MAG: DUF2304 domain-containing protein [Thiobacillus sp.]